MNDDQFGRIGPGRSGLPMLSDGTVLQPEFLYRADSAPSFDLRKAWSVLWRNRMLILAILAGSLALGALSLFLSDPVYRATSSIQIENQPVKILGTEETQPAINSQETDRLLQTQIDIMRSRALAEEVARDLNLAGNDDFLISQGVTPQAAIRKEQVLDTLRENLRVSLPRNSRVVPVAFQSGDRRLAAKVANSYVDNLITGNLQRHFDTSTYSKKFLENQLALTKARLEKSERSLLDYARSVGIVDPSAGGGDPSNPNSSAPRSLTSANLIDLNQSLAAAQAARMNAEGKWRAAQGTSAMNLPEVLGNPAVQQLAQKRAEMESLYEQELQRRKPGHPAVAQAAASIRELDRQIASLASSIRNSIRNQYIAAQRQEAQLAGTVGRLKGATLAEQQLGIRYNILKREVDTNNQLYNGLLQRYKEVSAEAGVTSNNISVIDRAAPPLFPIAPRPFVNLLLAGILGLIVAAVVVLVRERFQDAVRAPEEVEQRFGVPLLGVVPKLIAGASVATQLDQPESEISEAYQSVRASVELATEASARQILLITSSRAGEGKSTTALAIARDAAIAGRKVLLIDADMRRPSIHSLLGARKEPGLSNFLSQQWAIETVVQKTDTPNLFLLSAGPKPPSPAALLSGRGFGSFLNYLREHYDQIIIDSPPVLGLADAPRLASLVDATILVIEANRANQRGIDAAVRRLSGAGAQIIGCVLSKFDPKKADVGSAYSIEYYGYGKSEDARGPASLPPALAASGA